MSAGFQSTNRTIGLRLRPARKELQAPSMVRKVLLICGILSSLLYAGIDVFGGTMWKGYSFTSQPVSELFAIGAPQQAQPPLLIRKALIAA